MGNSVRKSVTISTATVLEDREGGGQDVFHEVVLHASSASCVSVYTRRRKK
jgi:hypothetical protein